MIGILPLTHLSADEVERVLVPYTSNECYRVRYNDSAGRTSFEIQLAPLETPYVGRYDHIDAEWLKMYHAVFEEGFSFGAYEDGSLVGFIVAEKRSWNNTLWVWDFHTAASHRRQGIGRMLMEKAVEKARAAGLRAVICETQNQNAPAIHAYRRLGFALEGIDISYYTNQDYPDRGIAVFMKLRLE